MPTAHWSGEALLDTHGVGTVDVIVKMIATITKWFLVALDAVTDILRYTGVFWSLFLIGPYIWLVGGLGEDQTTNIINADVEKRLDYVFEYYYLRHIL